MFPLSVSFVTFIEKCEDDSYQAEVCPFYRMAGFCEVDPELMKKHCKKTCGFCCKLCQVLAILNHSTQNYQSPI